MVRRTSLRDPVRSEPTSKEDLMAVKIHIPLAAEQQAVAVELQGMLVDLLDLTLIAKHAHWNVEGRLFRSVHQELDDLVDAWRTLSDDVAERAVAIGSSPDGQVEAIAGATLLEPVPPGHLSDRQVLRAMGERLADAASRTRERIERIAISDPVSVDLLIQVAATLEKQLWTIRAQIPGTGRVDGDAVETRGGESNGTGRS
jgi:starvation-inducible DNA-binding protein